MRIGLVADCYQPTVSGVVTSLLALKQELEQRGHRVLVVTVRTPGCLDKDGNVHSFPSLPFNRASGFRFGLVHPAAVTHIVRKAGLEVIHTHTEYSLGWAGKLAARHLGLPFLHTAHTLHEAYRHYLPLGRAVPIWLVRYYLRLFLSNCHTLVCPSEKARDYFRAFLPELNAVVVGNGVSRAHFLPPLSAIDQAAHARQSLGLSPSDQVILYAGRIAPEKRVVELLDALVPLLRARPEARLLLVGGGPAERDLSAAVSQHGVGSQVVCAGRVNWSEMHRFYDLADLFVTASLSEMQPMTLIEAALCGLPVVARRDPAYHGLVRDGYNGYLVDSDQGIAGRVLDLITGEEKRQRFSQNARALSEALSAEDHAEQLEAIYRRAIERPTP